MKMYIVLCILYNLKIIVLHGGVNDVSDGWNMTTILRRYQCLYKAIRQKTLIVHVVISGILP